MTITHEIYKTNLPGVAPWGRERGGYILRGWFSPKRDTALGGTPVPVSADSNMEETLLSTPELMESLRSSFQKSDFDKAERAVRSREESMRAEAEKMFSQEKEMWRRREDIYKQRIAQLSEELIKAESLTATFVDLEAVNRDLEIAKITAEAEVEKWKRRCEELEAMTLNLVAETPVGRSGDGRGGMGESTVFPKAELGYEIKAGTAVQGAGLKPGVEGVIEISDGEEEVVAVGSVCVKPGEPIDLEETSTVNLKVSELDQPNKGAVVEDESICKGDILGVPTPKRKRASRVVVSDTEGEDDDGDMIPTRKLRRKSLKEVVEGAQFPTSSSANRSDADPTRGNNACQSTTPSKRRLVPLRHCREAKGVMKETSPTSSIACDPSPASGENVVLQNSQRRLVYPTTGVAEEDEVRRQGDDEGDTSESEEENLGGYIVNESPSLESESTQNDIPEDVESRSSSSDTSEDSESGSSLGDASYVEEEEADSDLDIKTVLSRIQREKKQKKWEYEADMLSSFSKDPKLCLKAVCALYRRQTQEEQSVKESINLNGRGFSKLDAPRASRIAVFLLDGDPYGPLVKSIEDLEKYDPKGVDYCHKIANHYSKQLFSIYQNQEDPFFCPSH